MKTYKYILSILVLLAAAIAIYPTLNLINSAAKLPLEGKTYQMVNGMQLKQDENAVIQMDEEDEVKVQKTNEVLLPFPIYYEEKIASVYINAMAVINPIDVTNKKINYFSMIYQKDNKLYVKEKEKEKQIKDSFLFDGEDIYVFLEDTNVTFNKKTITLSPLSYVKVIKNSIIQYYDYKKKEFKQEKIKDDVTATLNDAKLFLHTDVLVTKDVQVLLYGKVDDLPNYE